MYHSEVSRPAAAATAAATNELAAWPMIDTRPKVLVTPDALQFAADLGTHVLDDEVHPIAFLRPDFWEGRRRIYLSPPAVLTILVSLKTGSL